MLSLNQIVEAQTLLMSKSNHRDAGYFHASEWDGCHRKIAYSYYEAKGHIKTNAVAEFDPKLFRIFDNGHSMHDRFKRYFENSGALMGYWRCRNYSAHLKSPRIFGTEERLGCYKPEKCTCGWTEFDYLEVGFRDDDTNWGGQVDIILDRSIIEQTNFTDYFERYLITDFKSIGSFQFKQLSEPFPKHKTQMQIYLYLSGLKYGKFLYECKDDQSIKEYLVVRDDHLIGVKREEATRLKYIITHPNSNGQWTLPKRAYNSKSHTECLRCKYRGHCWK